MSSDNVPVQLDSDLVARLDALAERLGTNRSDLLRRGALAVLEAHLNADADQRLAAAHNAQPQDAALVEAATRLAAQNTPPY